MVHIVQTLYENASGQTGAGGLHVLTHFLHYDNLLQEHSVLAVGEPCVQFLRFLQQPLLLRFIKAIHLKVFVPIEWSPLRWFVSLRLCFFLHRLGVQTHQRLSTFRLLITGSGWRNFSPEFK